MGLFHRNRIAGAITVGALVAGLSTGAAAAPSYEDPSTSLLHRSVALALQQTSDGSVTIVSLEVPWEPGDMVAATAQAPEPEVVVEEGVGEGVASRSLGVGRCGTADSWPNQVRAMITELYGITNIGGYRAGDPGDHGSGLALDVMVPGDPALGDSVAQWALANQSSLNVSYVIWQQAINMGGGWSGMEDRGSITANHYDHVHISLNPGWGTCG